MDSWVLALLAAVPILCACVLLAIGLKPYIAATAAVAAAAAVSALAFPISSAGAQSITASLGPVIFEVLLIILGGVLLGGLLRASGAQLTISTWIEKACAKPERAVLLVVLGITPFAESVTGFGLGVIVGIPILLHLGLSGTRAAVLGLMGLVVGPWGSLGPGTLVASQLGGVGYQNLGFWSALFALPVLLTMSISALGFGFGFRRAAPFLPHAVAVSLLMWGVLCGFNYFVGVPLAGAAASLVSIAATLLIARRADRSRAVFRGPIRRAVLPYGFLMGGLLTCGLLVDAFDVGGLAAYAASPGVWLLITCILTPALLSTSIPALRRLLADGLRAWWTIAFSTTAFLILGGLLAASGMSSTLAEFAAGLGPAYLAVIPLVGGIGGFITGSNTGASAMFSTSSVQAAQALQASPLVALAGQNVAASSTFMAAPPRIALAIAVAGGSNASAQEQAPIRFGSVFRPLLAANAVVLLVLGAASLLLA